MAKFDVYQEITNKIVEAMEGAGDVQMPWLQNSGGVFKMPVNVKTGQKYQGVNILSLWASTMKKEYNSNVWGTFKQWSDEGYKVKKGEKASVIVFYKSFEVSTDNPETGEGEQEKRMFARASWVFNKEQVEGGEEPRQEIPTEPQFTPLENAERFFKSTGAKLKEEGDRAFYDVEADTITMPEKRRFVGTDTSTPLEGYYSVLMHELTHWTGAEKRLGRDFIGRFGCEAYAIEELVAELGAAFLCADLGISKEPRTDHAKYLAHWLKVLKSDKKAIFAAASKAGEAVRYLTEEV